MMTAMCFVDHGVVPDVLAHPPEHMLEVSKIHSHTCPVHGYSVVHYTLFIFSDNSFVKVSAWLAAIPPAVPARLANTWVELRPTRRSTPHPHSSAFHLEVKLLTKRIFTENEKRAVYSITISRPAQPCMCALLHTGALCQQHTCTIGQQTYADTSKRSTRALQLAIYRHERTLYTMLHM